MKKKLIHKSIWIFYFATILTVSFLISLTKSNYITNIKNTPKMNANEIAIITPENITYTNSMSGCYPASYGFENDIDGGDPQGWSVFENGGPVNVIASLGDHNKVVDLYDTNTANCRLYKNIPNLENGTVEFWTRFSTNTHRYAIILQDENDENSTYLSIMEDGNIYFYNGSDHFIMAYSADVWYHIKIEFDCSSDWHLWIDGESKDNNVGYSFRGTPSLMDYIYFITNPVMSGAHLYVDAVGFSWDSDYAIGDNLNEGLLLSYDIGFIPDWQGYSLDRQANHTILGNTTISFPIIDGLHTIQVFGNNSVGTIFHSDVRYFTTQLFNIITPENKTYTELMSGYYPSKYGFENDVIGNEPTDWTVDEAAGPIQVLLEVDGHKNIVEIQDNHETFFSEAYQTFETPRSSGQIEFWWRVQSADHHNVRIRSGTTSDTSEAVQIRARDANMHYEYYDGSSWNPFCSYSDLTWHHIRIRFDLAQGWDIWVDGDLKSSGNYGFSFANNLPNVDNLQFTTGTGMQYDQWVDAVGYSWDPEYTIGDNTNEGLLLNFKNSTNFSSFSYSLDDQPSRIIVGNTTITFPNEGVHIIQMFGNNSLGTMYQSEQRYFTSLHFPRIIVNSPNPKEFFGINAPYFNITIIESNLNSTWYTLDSGVSNITFSGLTGYINQSKWENFGNGSVTIRFYVNDTWGLESFAEVSVWKDTYKPNSLLNFIPHRGSDVVNESTTFSLTANDGLGSGVSYIRYKINDSSWITYSTPFTLANYPYGDVLISYQAVDKLDNYESIQIIVLHRTDTITPTSAISFTPYRNTDIVIRSTTFTIKVNDDEYGSGIALIRYKIDDSVWFDYIGPFDLSGYENGDHIITYQAIDVAGNVEVEHAIAITLISEPSQPGIPGYHLFIFLGITVLITAILIKKKDFKL